MADQNKEPYMVLQNDLQKTFCHTLICFTCLCDCLNPPPGVTRFPHYSQGICSCVLCLSVASSSCLVNQRVFPCSCFFLASVFLVLLVLTFCLPWLWAHQPDQSACPYLELACLLVPFGTLTWLMNFCLSSTCLLPAPCCLINIRDSNHLPPVSASGSRPVSL